MISSFSQKVKNDEIFSSREATWISWRCKGSRAAFVPIKRAEKWVWAAFVSIHSRFSFMLRRRRRLVEHRFGEAAEGKLCVFSLQQFCSQKKRRLKDGESLSKRKRKTIPIFQPRDVMLSYATSTKKSKKERFRTNKLSKLARIERDKAKHCKRLKSQLDWKFTRVHWIVGSSCLLFQLLRLRLKHVG